MFALAGMGFLGIGTASVWWAGTKNWEVLPTANSQNIAIVYGDVGGMQLDLMANEITVGGFGTALSRAGHVVTYKYAPDEQEFIQLCNRNDIVVVLSHGAGARGPFPDYCDMNNQPFAGFLLGGKNTNPKDDCHQGFKGYGNVLQPPKEWITANELQGKITRRNLVVAAASCRAGKTNRLQTAMGAAHFAGPSVDIYGGGVRDVFRYVVDLVNYNAGTAAANYRGAKGHNIVDPTNSRFP